MAVAQKERKHKQGQARQGMRDENRARNLLVHQRRFSVWFVFYAAWDYSVSSMETGAAILLGWIQWYA